MNHGLAYHEVVIVGGGSAGITVAAQLLKRSPQLDVVIIEPSTKHYYQPLWTLVGGGVVSKAVSERQEKDLIPKGAHWIRDAVSQFFPAENSLALDSGKRLSYGQLVVAPGIQIDWHKVKGLPEALGHGGVCSNYSYRHVDYTWKCIQNFKGGRAIFTFPNTPIKCGGAPQKIMYLAEDYFRREGIRKKCDISFISAASNIFAVKKYALELDRIIAERGMLPVFKHNLIEIRADKKEAVFENLETKKLVVRPYDMLHVAPPMSAPDVVKTSPLANEDGWLDVDKFTLQSPRFANVFGLGDASSLPTSKTGSAIRKQAPVLVDNLLACRSGKSPEAKYDGYTSCPIVTKYGKLILAEFDYNGTPVETFPFDQSKERLSMYLLKKHVLPLLYWRGMLRGNA